jgi:DNA repair exonuclease SbcCD ATPase subunit
MIRFTKIRYKNFLSTGNAFTEIDFTRNKSTLVVGQNGAGKSTMLDAISFGLFGKPHRNINKPQLVNSVNGKNCVVEVEFTIGNNNFKIIRGISPGVFEVWKNDQMLNQSSHSKEYQKILEQNILKLNHKSFHQVVVLGSSSFIPFMQLQSGHRREVIEDLLDINIFSKMNTLLREQTNTLKESIRQVSYEVDISKTRIESHEKYIKDVQVLTEANIETKKKKISASQDAINELLKTNTTITDDIEKEQAPIEQEISKLTTKQQTIIQYQAQFKQRMTSVAKDAKFYEEHENCPTCSQDITEELRTVKLNSAKSTAKELKIAMDKAKEESTLLESSLSTANETLTKVREWQRDLLSNTKEITRLQGEIRELESEIASTAVEDLHNARNELKEHIEQKQALMERKLDLNDQLAYNGVISEMLKDTGIKTKIIKQYLPSINKLVNQYLQILDFFVHFDLDESFQETIRSRHRDEFTYESFSEGEKQRIDLSLLFTWRQVAKMKNSIATNLLILDETFDSSLDADGVENLLKILYTLPDDSNIFVISHKGEILDGKFENKIEFYKDKNFSKIKCLQEVETVI